MSIDSLGNSLTQRTVPSDGTGLSRPMIGATRHQAVAGHPLAAQAAFSILEAGGNAVDAGVAAGLVLSVVQSDVVNFAGVAPMLISMAATGGVTSIAGLGHWPRALPPDYFRRNHAGQIPHGVLRTVVPAAPDAWITALARFGTMSFGDVAREAIRLARDGFVMYPMMSNIITAFAQEYARWPSNASIYLPQGRPTQPGELFVQADLARTIQYMVDEEAAVRGDRQAGLLAARAAFYCGDIASTIVAYHREHGGLLRMEDLADYSSEVEAATKASFGAYDLFTCGPWCQGPALIEMLRLAQAAGVSAHPHNSADAIHLLVEVFKIAFDDRHRFFGDPRHVDVPLAQLLSEAYAIRRAREIELRNAMVHGVPSHAEARPTLDTSYVCVADRNGNVFSATPSDVSMDTPVIPGTGICPSSRGSQSWADPGNPSCAAAGKRPRLTPSPALAMFGDGRVMPFGTPGGDVQLQAMAQVFLNITAHGMNPQAAVDAPRFATYDFEDSFEPHTRLPGRVTIEPEIAPEVRDELARRGHDVVLWPSRTWRAGAVCVLDIDRKTGMSFGGADPRRPSYAIGA